MVRVGFKQVKLVVRILLVTKPPPTPPPNPPPLLTPTPIPPLLLASTKGSNFQQNWDPFEIRKVGSDNDKLK